MGLRIIICAKEDFETVFLTGGNIPSPPYILTEAEAAYLLNSKELLHIFGVHHESPVVFPVSTRADFTVREEVSWRNRQCLRVLKEVAAKKHSKRELARLNNEYVFLGKLFNWLDVNLKLNIDLEIKNGVAALELRPSRQFTAMLYIVDFTERKVP